MVTECTEDSSIFCNFLFYLFIYFLVLILSKSYGVRNKYIKMCFILSLEAARYSVVEHRILFVKLCDLSTVKQKWKYLWSLLLFILQGEHCKTVCFLFICHVSCFCFVWYVCENQSYKKHAEYFDSGKFRTSTVSWRNEVVVVGLM